MREIRIYTEGSPQLRAAFGVFFGELRNSARDRKTRWEVVACGSRERAFRSFCNALEDYPRAFNVLLVDSEGPVHHEPREHLKSPQGGGWDIPQTDEEQLHLMVQMMESWFLADLQALRNYYGEGFHEGAIPKEPDVERIEKTRIEAALKEATRQTRKGKYHRV